MPDFDGEIKLRATLTPGDIKKTSRELVKEVSEILDNKKGSTSSQMQRLEASISKTIDKANALSAELKQLEELKIPTEEYAKLQEHIQIANDSIKIYKNELKGLSERPKLLNDYEQVLDKVKELQAFISEFNTKEKLAADPTLLEDIQEAQIQVKNLQSYLDLNERKTQYEALLKEDAGRAQRVAELNKQIAIEKNGIADAQQRINELEQSGVAFIDQTQTQAYQDKATQLNQVNNSLVVQKTRVDELSQKEVEAAEKARQTFLQKQELARQAAEKEKNEAKATKEVAKETEKATKATREFSKAHKESSISMQDFGKGLKRGLRTILKYGFGIRSLYVLFRKLRTAVKEGLGNLEEYYEPFKISMTDAKNAVTQLKNSFATAFAPIIQQFLPVATTALQKLSGIVTNVAMGIAALLGQKTFVRATTIQGDYADSLKDTAKAAQEAKGQLAGFDELTVINTDTNGASDANSIADAAKTMFEEVPIEANADLERLLQKFAPFLKFLNDLKDKGERVVGIIKRFIDFFTGLNFEPLTTALSNFWGVLSPIIDYLIDIADWFELHVIEPITQFLVEKGIPGAIDLISTAIDTLWKIIQPLIDGLKQFWDDNGEWIMELFEDHTLTALGKIKEAFKEIGKFFEKNKSTFNRIFSSLSSIATKLSPLIKTISKMLGTHAWDTFVDSIKSLLDAIEPILTSVSAILEILDGILNLNPSKFMGGIGRIGKSLLQVILYPLQLIINAFATIVDALSHVVGIFDKDAAEAMRGFSEKCRTVAEDMGNIDQWFDQVITDMQVSEAEALHLEANQERANLMVKYGIGDLETEVTAIRKIGPTSQQEFQLMADWAAYCKKYGIDPLTGAVINTDNSVKTLPSGAKASANLVSRYMISAAQATWDEWYRKTVAFKDLGWSMADNLVGGFYRRNPQLSIPATVDVKNITGLTSSQKIELQSQKSMLNNIIFGKKYATGGFPSPASLFWAGENGVPEMLGTVGGKTAVAGGAEITGIREAIEAQGAAERNMLSQLISAVQNKDLTLTANSATGRWVSKSLKAYQGVTG